MKRYVFSLFFLIALISGLSLSARSAWAGSHLVSNTLLSQVNVFNPGFNDNNPNLNPFILQVQGIAGGCITLDVTLQQDDLEMVLISPSGRVWRSNNRSVIDLRPFIKAIADVTGFYTLQVSFANGSSVDDESAFNLQYLQNNNPANCSGATPPPILN